MKKHLRLTKKQTKFVDEFIATEEYQKVFYKYAALRAKSARAVLFEEIKKLAVAFVEKYREEFLEYAKEVLIQKFARRFQDMMQDKFRLMKKNGEAVVKAAGSTTTQVQFVKVEHDGISYNWMERLVAAEERRNEILTDIKNVLVDALFVKKGELKDRKTGKDKHVGWSWFHSLQSELAQIRGLSADKKEENGEKIQVIPVPYIQPAPYTPPPQVKDPPYDTPSWPSPSWPSTNTPPWNPNTITCSNSQCQEKQG